VLNLAAGLVFAAFAALGLFLVGRARAGPGRRTRVSVFLAFAVLASFGAGLSQRDAWPFSSWPLAASAPGRSVTYSTIAAVDQGGAEHAVDYRAWQPLGFDELLSWIQLEFPKLTRAEQDEAARDLLGRAEAARARAVLTGRVGYFDRFLGPLTAPDFLLHPRLWSARPAPPARFVALRVYSETLVLDAPARGGGVVKRTLDYEYP
jgi:hypothetical protein